MERLARQVIDAGPGPVTLDTADLPACLGLGSSLAKNSVGSRTVARMVAFDLARRAGRAGTLLAVRRALAAHSETRARRLPNSARRYHDHATAARPPTALFGLGELSPSRRAAAALARGSTTPTAVLDRHRHGDWGDVDIDEALANNTAISTGGLLHSVYRLRPSRPTDVVWVLTEPDRSATAVTTPEEL